MDAGYGQALYYPYIHIADEAWLKLAALYYDTLNRIVPYGYTTKDSDFVKALNNRTHFIRNLAPREELAEVQYGFLAFAREHLADKRKRAAIWEKLDGQLPPVAAVIHSNKFENETLFELVELGLAKRPKDWNEPWHTLDPLTAVLYMTFLANRMAQRRGLPVVSDDPSLTPLLRDFQSDETREPDTAFALASLVIETAIPVNLERVSAQQIAEFREFSEFERLRFYEAMRELAGDLPIVEDSKALAELLKHKQRIVADAVSSLKLCYRNMKIAFITGFLSLSVPAWSVSLGSVGGLNIPLLATGCITVGMAAQKAFELNKARRDSPWSYVLSLQRNFDKKALLKQLQAGTIFV